MKIWQKKNQPNFFQVVICFHPDHPWPKALIDYFSTLVVFDKTEAVLSVSIEARMSFGLFKLILKIGDIAPLIIACVASVSVRLSARSMHFSLFWPRENWGGHKKVLFCARPAKKQKMPRTCGKPYGNACYAGYFNYYTGNPHFYFDRPVRNDHVQNTLPERLFAHHGAHFKPANSNEHLKVMWEV